MQPHNPVIARNKAAEMAQHQLDAGRSLDADEWIGLGYSEEDLRKHKPEAARLFAQSEHRRAA